MAIKTIRMTVKGINSILLHNPQTVDPLNKFSKAKAKLTKKGVKKTEEDIAQLHDLDVQSKLYFADGAVYVPSTWVIASISSLAWETLRISKPKTRGALFATETNIALRYRGMNKVKTIEDLVRNHEFRRKLLVKVQKSMLCVAAPEFHDWSFTTELEYDDEIFNDEELKGLIERATKYGGFGDFRPTFGRAVAEVEYVTE